MKTQKVLSLVAMIALMGSVSAYGSDDGHGSDGNSWFGANAMGQVAIGSGTNNSALGYDSGVALLGTTDAVNNTFVGHASGRSNVGINNTFIGEKSGLSGAGGANNSYLGQSSGLEATGSDNTYLGYKSGAANDGINNTFVGSGSGEIVTGVSNSIFIGHKAGANSALSDSLYIANSDTVLPLVYGNFNSRILRVNGNMEVSAVPIGDSTNRHPFLNVTKYDGSLADMNWVMGILANDIQQFYLYNAITDKTPFYVSGNAENNLLVLGSTDLGMESNVGIGTDKPVEKVDVEVRENASRFQLTSITNVENQAAQFIQRRARSDSGKPIPTENTDNLGLFSFRGYNGTAYTGSKATIAVSATEDWGMTANGTQMMFRVTPNETVTLKTALVIKDNAQTYFYEDAHFYKDAHFTGNIYVKGTELSVPDYVFAEDYKLMPLAELKTYIDKNSHLPGVTSAKEVGKTGRVNMSSLQMTLLEKVEELTLYTLQQDEALAQKNIEVKSMKVEIEKLKLMQKRLARVESLLTNLALTTSNMSNDKVSLNLK